MWQDLCYRHVLPLLPLSHRCLLGTKFTPCLPVWLPLLSSTDTLPSRYQFGPAAQDRQKRYKMRAKLLRSHFVVPASGAECSLWCQEVSLHLLFCRDVLSMEGPGSEHGSSTSSHPMSRDRRPPGWLMCPPAHYFPLGLYVPCCRMRAGRAASQRGEELITATSYPCLPCAAGLVSLIPSLAFPLLFCLEGTDP